MDAVSHKPASLLSRLADVPGRSLGLHLVGLLIFVYAYRSLLTIGTRYGFSLGVEYWLFRPSDSTPWVILALSAWLLYRRRHRLAVLERSRGPVWLIVPACLLGLGIHVWATYTTAVDLLAVSLAFNCAGLVLVYWGLPGLRAIWLPIAFLAFAIPLPAPLLLALVWKLQIWTADSTGWMLHLLGLPALISGDQIIRASQSFQVVEGCSGLRSLQTLSMLTVLLIDLFGRRGVHALLLLLAAPPIAFALNGLRVLTLVLNPHSEIVAIHNLQGIAILMAGLLLIYFLDGLIERVAPARPTSAPGIASRERSSERGWLAVSSLIVVAVLTALAASFTPSWQNPGAAMVPLGGMLEQVLGESSSSDVEPEYVWQGSVRYRSSVHRRYELEDGPVTVFIGTADLAQRGGSPISPITSLPGSGYTLLESDVATIDDMTDAVDVLVVEKWKRRVLVHHWYHGSQGLLLETLRSLLALDRSPLRRSDMLYVVRLEAEMTDRSEEARQRAGRQLDLVRRRLQPVLRDLARFEST